MYLERSQSRMPSIGSERCAVRKVLLFANDILNVHKTGTNLLGL